MNKVQRNFKVSPIAAAIALAMTTSFLPKMAQAGSGFGAGVDLSNKPTVVPTYYANSPAGMVPALDPVTGLMTVDPATGLPKMVNSGKALRKFVDPLPAIRGLSPATLGGKPFATRADAIPQAVPEKWVDLNGNLTTDDYYEIAAVEFTQRMHSDLPKATRLRGYVQLSTAKNPGKHIALKYPDGTPIVDALGAQVYAYDNPHHLGPVITSTKGVATRVKFTNYLPANAGGNLFVPVDTTITGAGLGPDGVTPYPQNRAEIHLVGGQSPWISAGTPHQWVAPAAELTTLKKGVSTQNVPDMDAPGDGSVTLFFPNDMSARFTFMQDRTSGLTRLNSYVGLEAGYVVTDAEETKLIANKLIPAEQIPLIIEDKTFVPANVTQQDGKWNSAIWGAAGDLWFPHVYEPNQDPNDITGANPVGRWDYGPLFWPIFLPPYGDVTLPDVSFTPEAFMDTPVINGTAYPTVTVDPKAYRLRILNASNDRFLNLSLFQADSTQTAPQLDVNGNPMVGPTGTPLVFTNTEVKMVPAIGDAAGNPVGWDPVKGVQLPLPQYPALRSNITGEPSGPMRAWPVDNRIGGTPDPALAGPDFIVIGNDGGFLPNPVDVPAQPITYEANRRSITVGNIYGSGLLLGPAERSDAIVDFSQYAGKTLILYNDGPTPVPFNDPRNDYFTGSPDQTASGGTYSTKPGYGPNTRTMMQIVVNAAPAAGVTKFDPTPLNTALPAAYAATQPLPIVPATAYNAAFKTNDPDVYAHVATGSAAQPNLVFSTSPGGPVTLLPPTLIVSGGTFANAPAGNLPLGSGTGYDPNNPPKVVFNNIVNGVNCLQSGPSASATAVVNATTHQVTDLTNWNAGGVYTCAPTISFLSSASSITNAITVTAGGSGYTAPQVSFNTNGGPGSGAAATATIASTVSVALVGGTGYSPTTTATVSGGGNAAPVTANLTIDANGVITALTLSQYTGFTSVPSILITDPNGLGSGASATASIVAGTGVVTQINVSNTGTGYTSAPTVVITDATGTNAQATAALVDPATAAQLTQGGVGAQAVVNTTTSQSIPVFAKAEQELFDNYGRYNSTGGLELPVTNAVVQTTIPLNYIDTATETLGDNEVQIWKLVDNGLWTNTMHFNMVDVQLINRVGWDGTVKPPASNEVGWRDTLRLNPLEDVILAVRAKRPAVPFGQPQSVRAMDPSKPVGVVNPPLVAPGGVRAPAPANAYASGLGFTNAPALVVPGTNQPLLSASNKTVSYDNEFVWGSAILGHSENDLQRPVVYKPQIDIPDAPTNVQDALGNGTLSWTDPTPAGLATTIANPKNEIGFKILQATSSVDANGVVTWTYAPYLDAAGAQVKVPANKTSWTIPVADITKAFAVVAYNAAGDSAPSTPFADVAPNAPTPFTGVATAYNSVQLSWTPVLPINYVLEVWRDGVLLKTLPGNATGYVDNTVTAVMTYNYTVIARNNLGTATAGPIPVTTPMIPVAAPTIISAVPNNTGTSVPLRWTDNANNETAYWVDVVNLTTNTASPRVVIPRTGNQVAATAGTLTSTIATAPGNVYQFTVTAVNVTGAATSTSAPASITVDLSAPVAPNAPVVTLGAQTATRAPLSWPAVPVPVTVPATTMRYVVQVQTNGGAFVSLPSQTTTTNNAVIAAGNTYNFQVLAQATRFGLMTPSAVSNLVPVSTPPAASSLPVATAGAPGSKQITVTWTNTSSNITAITVQRTGAAAGPITPAITTSVAGGVTTYTFTDTVPVAGSYRYAVTSSNAVGSTTSGRSVAVVAP